VHIWIEICASLNHRKKTKADGSRLTSRKHTERPVLSSVVVTLCVSTYLVLSYLCHCFVFRMLSINLQKFHHCTNNQLLLGTLPHLLLCVTPSQTASRGSQKTCTAQAIRMSLVERETSYFFNCRNITGLAFWVRAFDKQQLQICFYCRCAVAYAAQWHTSQFDVIFMFPTQRFGEVCWHNLHIFLHKLSLFYVSLHWI